MTVISSLIAVLVFLLAYYKIRYITIIVNGNLQKMISFEKEQFDSVFIDPFLKIVDFFVISETFSHYFCFLLLKE